jgi:SNF2 family DNA or RNA helicase
VLVESEKEKKLDQKLRKLVFTIKQVMPDRVNEMTKKIVDEINSLEHVRKPWRLKDKEWEARKPTKLKVFKKYKKQICKRHIKDLWIRICKDKHNIKITTSNAQASAVLNRWLESEDWNTKSVPIWKLVIPHHSKAFLAKLDKLSRASLYTKSTTNHPTGQAVEVIIDFDWSKFLAKKTSEFERNRADLSKVSELYPDEYTANKTKLEAMTFPDKEFGEIKLLPHQVEDIASILIKDRALLSWSMGLGKTIAGLVWANEKGKKTLIVAPACNLIDPWRQEIEQRLPGTNFLVVTKRTDWRTYTGDERFLVVSLEALPMYEKFIARYRFDSLILDESDNIKNKTSKRAKVLKKLARHCDKTLCMTGTPTRNNAVEIYSQAELLLNNSANMLCTVETLKEFDRYDKEFRNVKNPMYMEPYPAHGGLAVFRKCFSPKKTTVFGAEKTNQTIFNKKELEDFMKPIRMTRSFEDEKPRIDKILGRKINQGKDSDIHQELVKMSSHEGEVYKFILDEFVKELEEYFRNKGHDNKTSKMLIIVRQIMSLLQAVSHPWTFASYDGPAITSKMHKTQEIFDMAKAQGRKVLFGSPWVPTIDYYAEHFSKTLPVFVIRQAMSKTKRSQVIDEYKAHDGFAVLMGTIGCMKSGLSIPEASVVITDSLTWNFATYSQFIARAIRLTSKQTVDVYALCNEGSFDVNVFSLMMKKEKINQYIRRGVEDGDKELLDKFGSSVDIFNEAIKMVKTKVNGQTIGKIEWNEKAIIDEAIAPTEGK